MSEVTSEQVEAIRTIRRIEKTANRSQRNSSIALAIIAIVFILIIIFFAILYYRYNQIIGEISMRIRDQVVWRNSNVAPGTVGLHLNGSNFNMLTIGSGNNNTSMILIDSETIENSPIGSQIMVVNKSNGTVTINSEGEITINPAVPKIEAGHTALLVKIDSAKWNVVMYSGNDNL